MAKLTYCSECKRPLLKSDGFYLKKPTRIRRAYQKLQKKEFAWAIISFTIYALGMLTGILIGYYAM